MIADILFADAAAAFHGVRRLAGFLPSGRNWDWRVFDEPDRPSPMLARMVPKDPAAPIDVRPIIGQIVDDSDWLELDGSPTDGVLLGLGRFNGKTVGLVATNSSQMAGALSAAALARATRLVRFCGSILMPVVILVDSPGLLPCGDDADLLRHATDFAVARRDAAVVSVVIRHAHGLAWALLGSGLDPGRPWLAWPTARCSLGSTGAANVPAGSGLEGSRSIDPARTRAEVIAALKAIEHP